MSEFKNLYEVYAERASARADKILFDNTYTYRQVWNMAKNKARYLLSQGLGRGDVVGILSVNGWEWCLAYMSITSIGAVVLQMDFNLNLENWQAMLDKVSAKALFVSRDFSAYKFGDAQIFDIHADWNDSDAELPVPQVTMQDTASLLFTSGTTSDPKIVPLTQHNVYQTTRSLLDFFWAIGIVDGSEYFLGILPLYHVYGMLVNFFAPLMLGGQVIFQNSLKGPDLIKSLSENPIHVFCGVPQLWELFFDSIVMKVKAQSQLKYLIFMTALNTAGVWRKIPVLNNLLGKIFTPVHKVIGPQMKFFVSGGSALKAKYFRYYINMGFRILEGYGLTETTGPALVSHPLLPNIGAVGIPTAGNEVDFRNVNSDGIGEIWLRGVSVMPGYYNNPKANEEAFDKDGWFNTGDLGFRDKKGELHITGRSKNVIVLDSGKNVYPEELEDYYQESDLIEDLGVFGYKINGSEVVFAVIVPRDKTKDSYQKIRTEIEKMNKGLPSYKVISNFAISFTPLPRNSIRKLVIREIVKELERGKYQRAADKNPAERQAYRPQDARQQTVLSVFAERLDRSVFFADQTMLELEIDSLKLLDITAHLEQKLGVLIRLEEISAKKDIKEMVEYAAACEPSDVSGDDLAEGPITCPVKPSGNLLLSFCTWLCGVISRRCWSLTVEHPEYYQTENCIFVANHQSYLDIIWMWVTMPKNKRSKTYILGKKELLFFSRFLGRRLPIIFVDRQGQALSSLKAGADILRQNASLVVFPEGTRSFDGQLGEFKIGAALLAKKLNKKIVPVKIKGAYEIYPRQKRLPNWFAKQKGEVVLSAPLDPADFATPGELNQKLKDVIARA